MTFTDGQLLTAAQLNDLANKADLDSAVEAKIDEINGYNLSAAQSADTAASNSGIAQNAYTLAEQAAAEAETSAQQAAAVLASAIKGGNTFAAGATLNSLLDQINDGTNLYYWTGDYPKVVPVSSTVSTTGGISLGAWVVVGDGLLRNSLASASEGAALIAMQQPFSGAVARTQDAKNAESLSLMDAGGSRNDVNPFPIDIAARGVAHQKRLPYLGADQQIYPMMGFKSYSCPDGVRDRGTVMAVSNVPSPTSAEPVTQVTNVSGTAGLAQYGSRDLVGLNTYVVAQPAFLVTSNTVFTANTVTAAEIGTTTTLKAGQVIDVIDASSGLAYSSFLISISGNTATVDSGWYLVDGIGNTTATPASGSTANFVAFQKVWGQNTNVTLNEDGFADSIVGYEMGLILNKSTSVGSGYGYDCVNLGTLAIGSAFQSRGNFLRGFVSYIGSQFGFVSFSATTIGFYSAGDATGFQTQGSTVGFVAKACTDSALTVSDNENNFITGMSGIGAWKRLKLAYSNTAPDNVLETASTLHLLTPTTDGQIFTLPDATLNPEGVLFIQNTSTTNSLVLNGQFNLELSQTLAAGISGIYFSDGVHWFPFVFS